MSEFFYRQIEVRWKGLTRGGGGGGGTPVLAGLAGGKVVGVLGEVIFSASAGGGTLQTIRQ